MPTKLEQPSLPVAPPALTDASAEQTAGRKQSHVEICLTEPIDYAATAGFERYRFHHNAAPELNLSAIDLQTSMFGRRIAFPLMVSSMTGGYSGATFINAALAEVCESLQIPLGVGSMRQALESQSHRESFSVIRQVASTIPVFANIGAAEVAAGLGASQYTLLLDLVRADGLIIHLNAAQELFQPEGNTNFAGFIPALNRLTKELGVPVIVKEVGSGISASVAERLLSAGVRAIDVAGAGGTSWQKVEEVRYEKKFLTDDRFSGGAKRELLNWGIPTADCLADIQRLRREKPDLFSGTEIIASGGITHGIEIAKSLALGATLAASAKPLLKSLFSDAVTGPSAGQSGQIQHLGRGQQAVESLVRKWMNDLRAAMFLTGAGTVDALRQTRIYPAG